MNTYRSRRRFWLASLALLGFFPAGCSSEVAAYPKHWAPIVGKACQDVAGTYHQTGDRALPETRHDYYPRLTWLLTEKEYFGDSGGAVTFSLPAPGYFRVASGRDERPFALNGKRGRVLQVRA